MLRDLGREAADIEYVLARMAEIDADIWVLQGVDYDAGGLALALLAERAGFAHGFALAPNSGLASGADLDGDGRLDTPRDAQGYGRFSGAGAMAILSRYPVLEDATRDYSALIWAELPWATLPTYPDGRPFPSAGAKEVQRLSTTAHWSVTIAAPEGPVTLLTSYATAPVFDGPEDRNGLRNADELRLLARMADDVEGAFVVIGDFNLDPQAGEGLREVMAGFLKDPRWADPVPGLPTVDFGADSAGKLRVSYALPSAGLKVLDAGVAWSDPPPSDGDTRFTRHHPVWVDVELEGGG
ncbi:MAG: endonuclease/exonuclease/phosphatase family protein [Pseudomonadota bacterium]